MHQLSAILILTTLMLLCTLAPFLRLTERRYSFFTGASMTLSTIFGFLVLMRIAGMGSFDVRDDMLRWLACFQIAGFVTYSIGEMRLKKPTD